MLDATEALPSAPTLATRALSGQRIDPRFSVPPLPPGLVHRPRLLRALDVAVGGPGVTLVTAGPGSGKTVLLSEWAAGRDGVTSWLTLGREDNDPGAFSSLLTRAVRAGQSTSDPLAPAARADPGVPGLVDALFGEAVEPAEPLVLVLDDAQVLTHPEILQGLDRMARRWAHRARLVVAARSIPLLPVHRYRLAGQLHEVRAAQLAMTDAETTQLLRGHGVHLSSADRAVLTTRTEGWAAGLRLAALRMQDERRPGDFVAEMAMDGGSIGEYLVAEVLSVLPEQVRRLLVQTSLLDEVTGGAAEAITGIDGCEELLAELARTNSFVVPLDSRRTTFRYHPLLREVLQYLARREPAWSRQETSARAARWFRSERDISSAIRWAVAGRDGAVVRSLLAHGLAFAFVHEHDLNGAVGRTVLPLPGPSASAPERAESDTAHLVVTALRADREQAIAALARIRDEPPRPDAGAAAPAMVSLNRELALLILALRAGDLDEWDRRAQPLVDAAAPARVDLVAGLRGKLLLDRARYRLAAGRASEVPELLARALDHAESEPDLDLQVAVLSFQALTSAHAGRMRQTQEVVAVADQILRDHHELTRPVALDLAVAARAYSQADLSTMAEAMSRAVDAGPVYAHHELAALVAYFQGMFLAACGRYADARAWLDSRVLTEAATGLLAVQRDMELAAIELALGRPHRALHLLEPHRGTPLAPAAGVGVVRALVELGDLAAAKAVVRRLRTELNPQVNRSIVVGTMLCEAQIALVEGDEPAAMTHLERARDLASGDLVMPFVRVTHVFTELLARHPEIARSWPDPRPFPMADRRRAAAPHLSVGVELTERERAVLRLLTTTMSAAEMAGELYLSVNTVKTHVAAIYRKMGVSRRREAVLRARELELL